MYKNLWGEEATFDHRFLQKFDEKERSEFKVIWDKDADTFVRIRSKLEFHVEEIILLIDYKELIWEVRLQFQVQLWGLIDKVLVLLTTVL